MNRGHEPVSMWPETTRRPAFPRLLVYTAMASAFDDEQ